MPNTTATMTMLMRSLPSAPTRPSTPPAAHGVGSEKVPDLTRSEWASKDAEKDERHERHGDQARPGSVPANQEERAATIPLREVGLRLLQACVDFRNTASGDPK